MMPMRIRRKSRPIEKLENPAALQRRGRSFPREHAIQLTLASTRALLGEIIKWVGIVSYDRTDQCLRIAMAGLVPAIHIATSQEVRDWPDKPGHAKLLRGQALPDMRNLAGKVTEHCGRGASKRRKSANFSEIGTKFLAAQRHTS
ncbi:MULTISPECIES: hypothetical protein [unclassified Bradyrhizobium]|jgi:hypothetical protein|uniref:hypothetical protein n=1 Tax=unclassified Bradyrhizobium TaxID=2631580 RepID=UPI001404E035|nr:MULTISPECIES: hypothetical protein [unclassified Bradyrhizobium]